MQKQNIDIFFIAANRLSTPYLPVGCAFVAQAAMDAGFTYEFGDVTLESEDTLIERIFEAKPRYVGISTMTLEVFRNYALIRRIKAAYDVRVILGGPHVLADGALIFEDCPEIDIAVQGEGEEAIVAILRGDPLEKISNVMFRKQDGEVVKNCVTYLDVDTINFPRYHRIPLRCYPPQMSIASSRGCVQSCIFCGARRFLGRKWRAFSSTRMFEEFNYWYDQGYRRFYFSDSLFSKDSERISSFCAKVKDSKIYDVQFIADGIRADHLTFKLLKKMRDTGFTFITIGVESVSNAVLKFMAKGETFEQIDAAIKMADMLNFKIGCFFILGSPNESLEEMKASLRFPLQYSNISMVHYHKLTPVPGTPYFDYAVQHGLADPATRYGTSDEFWAIAKHGTKFVSKDELQNMLQLGIAMEKFIEFRGTVLNFIREKAGGKTPTVNILNTLALDLWKKQGGPDICV